MQYIPCIIYGKLSIELCSWIFMVQMYIGKNTLLVFSRYICVSGWYPGFSAVLENGSPEFLKILESNWEYWKPAF